MKHYSILLFGFFMSFFLTSSLSGFSYAATTFEVYLSGHEPNANSASTKYYLRSEIEFLLGRKMNLAERVVYKFNRKKFIKVLPGQTIPVDEKAGTNGWAIAGLITAVLLPPVGLIISLIALGQVKKTGQKGKGLAWAGVIVGVLGTVLIIAGGLSGGFLF
jgi:hypothetical protein